MPLQKQTIPQPFIAGVDTKTDARLVRHPNLLKLENGTIESPGKISKRNGHELAATFADGVALFEHNGTLLGTDGDSLYVHDTVQQSMNSVGPFTDIKVTAEKITSGVGDCTDPSIAECDGFGVITWIDSGGGASFTTYDKTTGAAISSNILLQTGATKARAFGLDDRCVIVVEKSNQLLAFGVDAGSTTPVGYPVNLGMAPTIDYWAGCAFNGYNFDSSLPDSKILLLVVTLNTETEIYTIPIDSNGNETTAADGWVDRLDILMDGGVGFSSWWFCGSGKVTHVQVISDPLHYKYGQIVGGFTGSVSDAVFTLGLVSGPTIGPEDVFKRDTYADTNWCGGSWSGSSSTSDDGYIFYRSRYSDNYPSPGIEYQLERYVYGGSDTQPTTIGMESSYASSNVIAHNGIAVSEPFSVDGEDFFVLAENVLSMTSANGWPFGQKSYYMVSGSRQIGDDVGENFIRSPILARFMYTLSAHENANIALPVVVNGTNAYVALAYNQRVEKVRSSDSRGGSSPGYLSIDYYTSIAKVKLDFNSEERYQSAVLGDNLHFGGGLVQNYDGKEIAEHGFLDFPYISNINVASGSTLPAGTYLYKTVYEWVDAKGQIHRSSPSPTYTATLAGSRDPVLTIRKPHKTNRITLDRINVVVYRTTVGGSDVFYRVGSTQAFPDTAVTVVTYTDTTTDASIATNEILYTSGGEYENDPPPCSSAIASSKNRLWCIDEWGDVWYSKEWRRGEAVGFSLFLQKTIPQYGGRPTVISTLDDKTIIFKENKIFAVSGEGPQPNGENDTFSLAYELPNKVGCSNARSIIECDNGLLFKSNKGIYILDRGGNAGYLGAGVDSYNSLTITRAVSLPSKNQVRFYTSDGATLVYDYEHVNQQGVGNWSTFTNLESLDAVVYNETIYLLRSTGAIWKENTTFRDITTPIELRVQTAWLNFSGIQDWKRIYRVMLLGEKKSDHTLNISFAYNYEDADYQTASFATASLDDETFGDGEFGSNPYGGNGDGDIYQFRVSPARQQCSAVRVTIYDSDQSGTYESMTLTDLSVEVGVNQTSTKLSRGRSG